MIRMKTTLGELEIELFKDEAPETVKNFLKYVEDGFYNNTIFHRVIDNFMIQGGGFGKDMSEKETAEPIINEADNRLKNERGTLAMARTNVINSATSQFFINVNDNSFLNYRDSSQGGFGYCVFGRVTKGMDVVDKIKSVKTTSHGHYDDVPVEPVEILEVINEEKAV